MSQSPTITTPAMTQAGMILGTAAYMSPEQARGKTVDKRTDIWAFGCVLFEMLTGRRAFNGETTSDAIAAILEWPGRTSSMRMNAVWRYTTNAEWEEIELSYDPATWIRKSVRGSHAR